MRQINACTCIALFLFVFANVARAQILPIVHAHVEDDPTAAISAFGAGDINGDGFDDYILYFLRSLSSPIIGPNTDAAIISGRFGIKLVDYTPSSASPLKPNLIYPCGDLDGDSRAEFLTHEILATDPPTNIIRLHSGLSTLPLFTLDIGPLPTFSTFSSRSLGDLNGDGIREIGIAYRDQSTPNIGRGFITVFSGSDGSVVDALSSTNLQSRGVGTVGDLNNDGVEEYFFTRLEGTGIDQGPYTPGSIEVRDGATSAVLQIIGGSATSGGVGAYAYPIDDLDGDGNADIVSLTMDISNIFQVPNAAVEAYSSATGNLLWTTAPAPLLGAQSLFEAGDVNGDGHKDFILTATLGGAVFRRIISGSDGARIEFLQAPEFLPVALGTLRSDAFVGDLNGDGMGDRIEHSISPTGIPRSIAHISKGSRLYGFNQQSTLNLEFDNNNEIPSVGAYQVTGASPFAALVIAASLVPQNSLIAGTSLPLLVSLDPGDLIVAPAVGTDALGTVRVLGNLTNPALAGTVIYLQAVEIGPSLAVSNGLEVLFGM